LDGQTSKAFTDKDKEPRRISKRGADRYFMQQVLTGDATDGYPGCPGVGPKSKYVQWVNSAETLTEMWAHVVSAYETKKLKAADAVMQARMARILRAEDWDFQKKAPRLWCPPVN